MTPTREQVDEFVDLVRRHDRVLEVVRREEGDPWRVKSPELEAARDRVDRHPIYVANSRRRNGNAWSLARREIESLERHGTYWQPADPSTVAVEGGVDVTVYFPLGIRVDDNHKTRSAERKFTGPFWEWRSRRWIAKQEGRYAGWIRRCIRDGCYEREAGW